jgi:phospholipid/cholesterol/gamma-HCH transport system substrate-binding protein
MPRTRSLAWSELKIGILAVSALIIAAFLISMLGGQGGFFWQQYHLKTRFPNVATIKPGSPVRVAGVVVGAVDSIEFVGTEVEVNMELLESVHDRVRTTSRASIGSVSLLGEGAVDITASLEGEPIPEWGYVTVGPSTGALSDVLTQGSRGLEEATALLQDIRAGKGTLGRLVTDEQLYRELSSFVAAAEGVVESINKGNGSLGRFINDPTAARELEASLKNLTAVTARINSGEGSLGRLIQDDSFAETLASTTTNADAITARIAKGEGTAGKLINDPALYNRLDSLTTRLDSLIARLNAGEGSAGQLLQDRQLYDNMNAAAGELRSLVADIRKDPRKYLRIQVSIF